MMTPVEVALKKHWFKLASEEDYPNTPAITADLDELTKEIRKMQRRCRRTGETGNAP